MTCKRVKVKSKTCVYVSESSLVPVQHCVHCTHSHVLQIYHFTLDIHTHVSLYHSTVHWYLLVPSVVRSIMYHSLISHSSSMSVGLKTTSPPPAPSSFSFPLLTAGGIMHAKMVATSKNPACTVNAVT